MRLALLALILLACDKGPVANHKPAAAVSSVVPPPAQPSSSAASASDAAAAEPAAVKPTPAPMPPAAATKPLVLGNDAFGVELWPRVTKKPGNAVVSPASISAAVAMAYLGAKGETAAQVAKTMRFSGDADAVAGTWGAITRSLATSPSLTFRVANRLFGEKTYSFEPSYLDKTKALFGAPLEPTDFKGALEPSRQRINGWVEEVTEKRIKDLLPPDALDGLTRLVLVNAIYFLADWASPFEAGATKDDVFELSAANKKKVPTMHRTGRYALAQLDGAKLLELPYKGEAAMIVALPEKKDGLPALEKALTPARLEAWRAALGKEKVEVDVALPKFELSPETVPLADALVAMGMPLAFDREKADFTRIANPSDPRERLHVGKAFHKGFVKIDEKGTEAAAATALAMGIGGGMPAPATPFVADHPFLFFIVEKTTGLLLFMGRVSDPSAR